MLLEKRIIEEGQIVKQIFILLQMQEDLVHLNQRNASIRINSRNNQMQFHIIIELKMGWDSKESKNYFTTHLKE